MMTVIHFILFCLLPLPKLALGDVIRLNLNGTFESEMIEISADSEESKEIISISSGNSTSLIKISETMDESPVPPVSREDSLSMDSLTIIWYITTFIALLGFFIVMACTENSCSHQNSRKPTEIQSIPPSPCPSYKHFAPPSYESVMEKNNRTNRIFIVPVHQEKHEKIANQVSKHKNGESGHNRSKQDES